MTYPYVPATFLCACRQCDFVTTTCPSYMSLLQLLSPMRVQHTILWLQHVTAICAFIITPHLQGEAMRTRAAPGED